VDGSSGFGLPTRPPSRHDRIMTVASWAFVPFTAAGQRGFLTPLPLIHPLMGCCLTEKIFSVKVINLSMHLFFLDKIQSSTNNYADNFEL
jgi:hypothetical protein